MSNYAPNVGIARNSTKFGASPTCCDTPRTGSNAARTANDGGTVPETTRLPTNGTIERTSLTLPNDWVIPTGGGYFFSPAVSALRDLAA